MTRVVRVAGWWFVEPHPATISARSRTAAAARRMRDRGGRLLRVMAPANTPAGLLSAVQAD
jgi:hypothetical protein